MTNRKRWARAWFAVTGLAVVAGLAIQVPVAASGTGGYFSVPWERGLNVLAFFTVQSNILVGVASFSLALREPRSTGFAVLRMTGLVAITITGIVYHVALRGLLELDTWGLAADQLLHTVVPVMAIAGWMLFGPRRRVSTRIALLSLVFPVAWLAFTLVRGSIVPFYPYPFVDVTVLGYAKTVLNCLWVALLFVAIAGAYTGFDRALARHAPLGPQGIGGPPPSGSAA
ncbi:MAG: Pr6Pr family membrane protein [Actinomycetota bacterium]|nr:Pr6Pr family membrane protein [Actinomycetota bacterium]